MAPGKPNEYSPATEAAMDIKDWVREAMETLGAPEELRRLGDNFDYDPIYGEWGFDGYYFKGPKALTDPGVWVKKICDWLQVNYPDGPLWTAEESGV
jgi:hypothetical protein